MFHFETIIQENHRFGNIHPDQNEKSYEHLRSQVKIIRENVEQSSEFLDFVSL